MSLVTYSMTLSLDGFIAGPSGEIDFGAPSSELHAFHNEQVGNVAVHLCGRRLYETMVYWETAEQEHDLGPVEREFAGLWRALPKVVFSRTLKAVEGNARLATAEPAEELRALREAMPDGEIAVGGAGLAAQFAALDLIDEYLVFIASAILGGGTPFFAPLAAPLELELVASRTFDARVAYLRYRRVRG